MEKDRVLTVLRGSRVGHYRTKIEYKPLRSRQGSSHFFFYFKDQRGNSTSQKQSNDEWIPTPVLEGRDSRGGRGVTGWIREGATSSGK